MLRQAEKEHHPVVSNQITKVISNRISEPKTTCSQYSKRSELDKPKMSINGRGHITENVKFLTKFYFMLER